MIAPAPRPEPLPRELTRAVLDCVSPFRVPPPRPPGGVDADQLLDVALTLGVAPPWAANLPAGWLEAVPGLAAVQRRMGAAAMAQALLADGVRRDLLALAEQAGARVAVVKGAFTEPVLYDRPGQRAMVDVDVLASPGDCARLHPRLLAQGYTRVERAGRRGALVDAFEWTYRSPRARMMVDLHRYPCEQAYFSMDTRGWLDRRVLVPTRCGVIPGLCPEDQVLLVALHAASHGFDLTLATFVDLAHLAARFPIRWPAVTAQARASGAAVPVWLTLRLLQDLLGWPGGRDVLAELEPAGWRQRYLAWRVGWEQGTLHRYGTDNRARLASGIFPLLSGPDRVGRFLVTYLRRRVRDRRAG